jgi:hypothetical protein
MVSSVAARQSVALRCLNCGEELAGQFCYGCGQDSRPLPRTWYRFLADQAASLVGWDSRLARTLASLLFRPGQLTREFLDGRRSRYMQPLAIYLLCASGFFLLHTFRPFVTFDPETRAVHSALASVKVRGDVPKADLDRLAARGITREAFATHFESTVSTLLPVFLLAGIFLFAMVVALLNRRHPDGFVAHAVFALHWGAFYVTISMLDRGLAMAGLDPKFYAGLIATLCLVYLCWAVHRVYGRSWGTSVGVGLALQFSFYLLVGLWQLSVMVAAAGVL